MVNATASKIAPNESALAFNYVSQLRASREVYRMKINTSTTAAYHTICSVLFCSAPKEMRHDLFVSTISKLLFYTSFTIQIFEESTFSPTKLI